ncbi:DUF3653 domain-containing protein [Paenibacillus sp. MB22_1]|uniref:DUF3653 domain-containing protein n=1 Tax=Paenibacillus sp. MB22_1 TaxID=3383121 RepID=UPI0039A20CFB
MVLSGAWEGWILTQDELISPSGRKYRPIDISDYEDLVGYAEAAEILGWDKRHVGTYLKRGTFPEPIQRLASGPIWTRKQIEDYRDARK